MSDEQNPFAMAARKAKAEAMAKYRLSVDGPNGERTNLMENEAAKALHDGLDRLRERGLTKNKLCDLRTGAVCSLGALVDATPQNEHGRHMTVPFPALRLLNKVSAEQYPDRVVDRSEWPRPLLDFNNHPDTTQEDVERVFEKAIVRAYEMEV